MTRRSNPLGNARACHVSAHVGIDAEIASNVGVRS